MQFPLVLKSISLAAASLELFVPDPVAVEDFFRTSQASNHGQPIPYWAQLWPSAIAMAQFLEANPQCYVQRMVLELGAGLGLPALVTAPLAAQVVISDLEPQAVATIRQSIHHHGYQNCKAVILDWSRPETLPVSDLVILSDVNYDRDMLGVLQQTIHSLLASGCTLLLATPQRLMARDFVNSLLPAAVRQETIEVWHQQRAVPISILQLDPPSLRIRP